MANKRKYSDRVLLKRLFVQAGHFWPHLLCLLGLSLFAEPHALLVPLSLKMAADNILDSCDIKLKIEDSRLVSFRSEMLEETCQILNITKGEN
jgi:hypothetical protein